MTEKRSTLLMGVILMLAVSTVSAQNDTMKTFIFGHSLLDHRPPLIPTPSNETTVPHWLYLLAQAAGDNFAAGGQYGFLPQHANVPPIAQWGYDIVPGAWDSDNESFADANISNVLITAGNFVQWQAPNLDYPSDPGVTPISATETIMDWVRLQDDTIKIYLYENWPDMAPYLNNGFPATAAEFDNYNSYTTGAFHDWWLEYQDALLLSRPNINVRMIPVGPVIAGILTDLIPGEIAITDLYEDDAPHGRATIYFLAGMVTYMALYEQQTPASYVVPNIIDSVIRNNYASIRSYIWTELQDFNDNSGNSRVFFGNTTTTSIEDRLINELKLYPNPTNGQFQLEAEYGDYAIAILDQSGRLVDQRGLQGSSITLDISMLPAGLYFTRIENLNNGVVEVKRILKN